MTTLHMLSVTHWDLNLPFMPGDTGTSSFSPAELLTHHMAILSASNTVNLLLMQAWHYTVRLCYHWQNNPFKPKVFQEISPEVPILGISQAPTSLQQSCSKFEQATPGAWCLNDQWDPQFVSWLPWQKPLTNYIKPLQAVLLLLMTDTVNATIVFKWLQQKWKLGCYQ